MKAMLLAAGKGERMYPLTLELPKAAIPVLGRPMALQILNRMAQAGIEEAAVNLHHLPQKMREVLEKGFGNGIPALHLSHEETILGTAGGLRRAAPTLRGDGPILVHNSDSLADIDLLAALRAHQESGHLATLVLTRARPGYSLVDVDGQGRVLSLAGKPSVEPGRVAASYLFTGCHILDESLLDRSPVKSIRYRGWNYKIALTAFTISFLMLGWLGMQPATTTYTWMARFFTMIYFLFFILMPFYTSNDNDKAVPERVTS